MARFAAAVVLIILGFASASASARAQSLWLPRDTDCSVMLEMARPNLERFNGGVLSSAYFLGGRFSVSHRVALVAEVPYAHLEGTNTDYYFYPYYPPYSEGSSLGDVYVGMETKAATGPIFGEVGVRLPTAGDKFDALYAGARADLNRSEAFFNDVTTIQAAINVRQVTDSKTYYRVRLSPAVSIANHGDAEVFAHYSMEIGYAGRWLRAGGGAAGMFLVTDDYSNLGTRGQSQLELHADFLSGSVRPGLGLRVPIGAAAITVPVVLGVTLSYVR